MKLKCSINKWISKYINYYAFWSKEVMLNLFFSQTFLSQSDARYHVFSSEMKLQILWMCYAALIVRVLDHQSFDPSPISTNDLFSRTNSLVACVADMYSASVLEREIDGYLLLLYCQTNDGWPSPINVTCPLCITKSCCW